MKKITLFLIFLLVFSFSHSQTDCPTGEILDCNGNCAPVAWVGDQYCDDGSYSHNGVLYSLIVKSLNVMVVIVTVMVIQKFLLFVTVEIVIY